MSTGEKIREVMRLRRVNQTELAKRIGTSRQNINNLLKSDSCNTNTLQKIAKALNTPISAFFEESTDQVNEPQSTYTKKPKYIEQRLDEIEERLKKIEDISKNTDTD